MCIRDSPYTVPSRPSTEMYRPIGVEPGRQSITSTSQPSQPQYSTAPNTQTQPSNTAVAANTANAQFMQKYGNLIAQYTGITNNPNTYSAPTTNINGPYQVQSSTPQLSNPSYSSNPPSNLGQAPSSGPTAASTDQNRTSVGSNLKPPAPSLPPTGTSYQPAAGSSYTQPPNQPPPSSIASTTPAPTPVPQAPSSSFGASSLRSNIMGGGQPQSADRSVISDNLLKPTTPPYDQYLKQVQAMSNNTSFPQNIQTVPQNNNRPPVVEQAPARVEPKVESPAKRNPVVEAPRPPARESPKRRESPQKPRETTRSPEVRSPPVNKSGSGGKPKPRENSASKQRSPNDTSPYIPMNPKEYVKQYHELFSSKDRDKDTAKTNRSRILDALISPKGKEGMLSLIHI
eukprot:TRINITY_DN13148_c0_g1_i1.p1 TRINITY_DN13148_c0_g1~~TRINITY_DN13148_c0_g1_i1.p1  ORF type:complete len:420 (+),score=74.49 TRINITY_DN13148_c0_g1_i1:61-1260(+)